MAMTLTKFHKLVRDEFGDSRGSYLLDSHVISELGVTAAEAVEGGADLREVWELLCADFDIPEQRRLGVDE